MKKDKLKPMLFSVMKGYGKEQLIKDIVAGIIVAIIALPLSIALALASGVGPEEGIYTAIIAGFIIAFLGGSRVQIAGPTAAFATIVAGIVAKNGMDGLMLATIMAGIILIIMGFLRLGNLIKFIPYTITTGFTAGIAVTIVIGQIKDFCGITYLDGLKPIETLEKLEALFKSASTFNYQALIVGAVCLAILFIWPKISKKIPGSLIAVIVGILMVKCLGMRVNTIGDLYTIRSGFPSIKVPSFNMSMRVTLLPDAFTIAILAGIESLLSCVVADSMINSKHRSNMELIAQGAGNITSALFGGIPATGAIARMVPSPPRTMIKSASDMAFCWGYTFNPSCGIPSSSACSDSNTSAPKPRMTSAVWRTAKAIPFLPVLGQIITFLMGVCKSFFLMLCQCSMRFCDQCGRVKLCILTVFA